MTKLGTKVHDRLTGFSGIVVGRTEWLTGCATIGVASPELHEGKPKDTQWFDENRISIDDETPIVLAGDPGGPQSTPGQGR